MLWFPSASPYYYIFFLFKRGDIIIVGLAIGYFIGDEGTAQGIIAGISISAGYFFRERDAISIGRGCLLLLCGGLALLLAVSLADTYGVSPEKIEKLPLGVLRGLYFLSVAALSVGVGFAFLGLFSKGLHKK